MANQWFRFKQFKINQDKTSMKVGTDGVLLGAWADVPQQGEILDVGTGTGLIALMLAQRTKMARITGIDIDSNACLQAKENVRDSKWAERINILNNSLQNFTETTNQKFDYIICNPPFFDGTKVSGDHRRNMARHDISLSMSDFFLYAVELMKKEARLALIIPTQYLDKAKKLAGQQGLFIKKLMNVKPVPNKPSHRIMLALSFFETDYSIDELTLETGGRHCYSEEYEALTRDFYLFFD